MTDRIGTQIAGYRIEALLGRGGMGEVYLATHLGLERKVALKVLAPELAADPQFRERFVRESRVAASVDHPNVIPIYEAGESDGDLFIAMRYVEGTDLRALLHQEGKLDTGRVVQVIRQVGGALDSAHARGLVHRDVKPGNVLIASADGSQAGEHVYLSDFGLTKRAASDSGVTGTGQFVGTLEYASPEQFEGKPLDARSDIYSLGCVLYECLAGQPPFRKANDAAVMYGHLMEAPPPIASVHRLPSEIDAVIARALAKNPTDRYDSAGEFAMATGVALGYETGERAIAVKAARRPRQPNRRRAVMAGAAAIVALIVIAILLPRIGGSGGDTTPGVLPAGMALVDASTGARLAFIPRSVVKTPAEVIYADGHFWVLNLDPISFVEIEPKTGKIVKQIASPLDDVGYFAVEGNTLWVTAYSQPILAKVDIGLGREVDRFDLSDGPDDQGGSAGVVVADGSVWVGRKDSCVVLRLDPQTGEVQHRFDDVCGTFSLAFGDGSIWLAGFPGVNRIDPETNTVAKARGFGGGVYVAAGGGYGWTADETKGVVYKIGQGGDLVATYDTGEGARAVSYSDGVLWVGNQDVGTVVGIDAVTGHRTTYRFQHPLQSVAAGAGVVLVQLNQGRTYEDKIDALQGSVAKFLVNAYQLENLDPALSKSPLGFQVSYATCASLLRYPDEEGAGGALLQPEVATAMPMLSPDGLTYTFTVRSGFVFSPPSNEPVTAETFRHSIERALSPKLGPDAPAPSIVGDIEGEDAYVAGEADHISGLRVDGDSLSITLTEPAPDFLARISLPYFCPVPIDTPSVPGGPVRQIPGPAGESMMPSAGPYYVSDAFNGEYAILKRNPNYAGPRPHALDAIALREGIDPGEAIGRVQDGDWDGIVNLYDPLLDPTGAIAGLWGPTSPAADGGDQRYFSVPFPGIDAIAFNASRPPFSDPTVRRAAALALNRSALASAFAEAPTSQLLPPSQPGYQAGADSYPLDDADLAKARALMHGRTITATLASYADCPPCDQWAEQLKGQLGAIGITIEVKRLPDVAGAITKPNAPYDLFNVFDTLDYSDPAGFLIGMLGTNVPTSWLPASVPPALDEMSSLTGEPRDAAAADLARSLISDEIAVAAFAYGVDGQFFSDRLGCKIFPPFGYGVDLAALCPG